MNDGCALDSSPQRGGRVRERGRPERRQHFEEIGAVALHLAFADAGDGEEIIERLRLPVRDFQQGRIVEDDIRRQVLHRRQIAAPRAQGIPQIRRDIGPRPALPRWLLPPCRCAAACGRCPY